MESLARWTVSTQSINHHTTLSFTFHEAGAIFWPPLTARPGQFSPTMSFVQSRKHPPRLYHVPPYVAEKCQPPKTYCTVVTSIAEVRHRPNPAFQPTRALTTIHSPPQLLPPPQPSLAAIYAAVDALRCFYDGLAAHSISSASESVRLIASRTRPLFLLRINLPLPLLPRCARVS